MKRDHGIAALAAILTMFGGGGVYQYNSVNTKLDELRVSVAELKANRSDSDRQAAETHAYISLLAEKLSQVESRQAASDARIEELRRLYEGRK